VTGFNLSRNQRLIQVMLPNTLSKIIAIFERYIVLQN
jgi:hypothetical protein